MTWKPLLEAAPLNPGPEPMTFDEWFAEFSRLLRVVIATAKEEGGNYGDQERVRATGKAWADIREHARKRIA